MCVCAAENTNRWKAEKNEREQRAREKERKTMIESSNGSVSLDCLHLNMWVFNNLDLCCFEACSSNSVFIFIHNKHARTYEI